MDNIYTSLSLALIAEKRFVVSCKNSDAVISSIQRYVLAPLSLNSIDIDLQEYFRSHRNALESSKENYNYLVPKTRAVVLWKHADLLNRDEQKVLVKFLNEVDEYDTNESKVESVRQKMLQNASNAASQDSNIHVRPQVHLQVPPSPTQQHHSSSDTNHLHPHSQSGGGGGGGGGPLGHGHGHGHAHGHAHGHTHEQNPNPNPLTIILVVENNYAIIQQLRYKFAFCQFYSKHALLKTPSGIVPNYLELIETLRAQHVHVAPDIQRYIYSLIVHTRNHRLCSISPMETRLPTFAIQSVQLIAESYVKWTHAEAAPRKPAPTLFVTPDICKIAMRKVAYWLINWQSTIENGERARAQRNLEARSGSPVGSVGPGIGSSISVGAELGAEKRVEGRREDEIDDDTRKRLEMLKLSSLGADWYGTDWKYVKGYIENSREKGRHDYNVIVESALERVQPPI